VIYLPDFLHLFGVECDANQLPKLGVEFSTKKLENEVESPIQDIKSALELLIN